MFAPAAHLRSLAIVAACVFASACGPGGATEADAGAPPEDAGAELPPDAGSMEPIAPVVGATATHEVDCTQAWTAPVELTGPDGLESFGWSWADLTFTIAWNKPNELVTRWISSNDDAVPSARVRPQLTPSAGYCFRDRVGAVHARMQNGEPFVDDVLTGASAFAHQDTGLDAMREDLYTAPAYDFSAGNPLFRALHGLSRTPNPWPGAPTVQPWTEAYAAPLRDATNAYPAEVQEALARLVLAIGEAHALKLLAVENADPAKLQALMTALQTESYTEVDNTFLHPRSAAFAADLRDQWKLIDVAYFHAAAQAVATAADEARVVLAAWAATGPNAPTLDVATPHGRVVIRGAATNDAYTPDEFEYTTLVVDLGGDDVYEGRYASTSFLWMSASVVLDVAGADQYSPGTADLEAEATTAAQAFDVNSGFTQGSGVLGVALLMDADGDDRYRASVWSQGAGFIGVGLLVDLAGVDEYRLGNMGQGAGFFGTGLLIDALGDDRYRAYSLGQGVGKPAGLGALIDGGGDDDYLGYNAEHLPELPGSGVKNYYRLPASWAYGDGTRPHYMSIVQGVGWGYRGDWFGSTGANWMGGMGAFIDLGGGNDRHVADTFSMGQGFVYGFGAFFDDGGDDTYRSFWWGPGAAAHMGVALFVDEGGNDDLYVTRASAGFGYDASVAWVLDRGGDDTYGGQMHYGEAYTYGLSFFIDEGGADTYNAGGARVKPMFGGVRTGFEGVNLLGAFLDLGGGVDTYVDPPAGVGNDLSWYPEPVAPLSGQTLDPAHHRGIGVDR